MDIFENTVVPYDGTVVALGNFDGLHAAHTELIKNAIKYASDNKIKCGVLLFSKNTKSVLEKRDIGLITDNGEKLEIIEELGADFVYKINFDGEFMKKTPEEFIEFLRTRLKIKAVFAGFDYTFGRGAAGNTKLLEDMGKKHGFSTIILPEVKINGITVSSTCIRSLIQDGRVAEAWELLGRSFCMSGTVEKGFQNGRKLGFPTANVGYNTEKILPAYGVYAGYARIKGKYLPCVINVGNNPTFNAKKTTLEAHITDFAEDIYGEYIDIYFIRRIRGEIKFAGIDELKKQIEKDVEAAKKLYKINN